MFPVKCDPSCAVQLLISPTPSSFAYRVWFNHYLQVLISLNVDGLPQWAFNDPDIAAAFRAGLACALGLDPNEFFQNASQQLDADGKPIEGLRQVFDIDSPANQIGSPCDAFLTKSPTRPPSPSLTPTYTGTSSSTASPTAARTQSPTLTATSTRSGSRRPSDPANPTAAGSRMLSALPTPSATRSSGSCSPVTCDFWVQPFIGSVRYWTFSRFRGTMRVDEASADSFRLLWGSRCFSRPGEEWHRIMHVQSGRLVYFDGRDFRADRFGVDECPPPGMDAAWAMQPASLSDSTYYLRISRNNGTFVNVNTTNWLNLLDPDDAASSARRWLVRYQPLSTGAGGRRLDSSPRLLQSNLSQVPSPTTYPAGAARRMRTLPLRALPIVESIELFRPGTALLLKAPVAMKMPWVVQASPAPVTVVIDQPPASASRPAPASAPPAPVRVAIPLNLEPVSPSRSALPTLAFSVSPEAGDSPGRLISVFPNGTELLYAIQLIANYTAEQAAFGRVPTAAQVIAALRAKASAVSDKLREAFELANLDDSTPLDDALSRAGFFDSLARQGYGYNARVFPRSYFLPALTPTVSWEKLAKT